MNRKQDDNYKSIQQKIGNIFQRFYEETVRYQPWLGFYTVSALEKDEIIIIIMKSRPVSPQSGSSPGRYKATLHVFKPETLKLFTI